APPVRGRFAPPPPAPPPPPSSSSPPPRVQSRPALTHLKIHPARIHLRSTRPKPSAKITFVLSQAAIVRLRFARCHQVRGRGSGCARSITVGGFTVNGRRGANVVHFSGRLAHRLPLAPGVYKPTGAAIGQGIDSGAAQAARLTVLPERRKGGR